MRWIREPQEQERGKKKRDIPRIEEQVGDELNGGGEIDINMNFLDGQKNSIYFRVNAHYNASQRRICLNRKQCSVIR